MGLTPPRALHKLLACHLPTLARIPLPQHPPRPLPIKNPLLACMGRAAHQHHTQQRRGAYTHHPRPHATIMTDQPHSETKTTTTQQNPESDHP